MFRKASRFCLLIGALSFSAASNAVPVVPGEGLPGSNFNNCIPFGGCGGYYYYQQVFDAEAFGGATGVIGSIAFRLDEEDLPPGSFSDVPGNFEVWLSHTDVSSETMSGNFAANRGADRTLVLSGSRLYSGTELPGSDPNPFDFVLDVDDTFFYNGMANLLLEVIVISPIEIGGRSLFLDAVTGTSYTSRVYGTNPESGSLQKGFGLIAQFDLIPPVAVPEPGTLALLLSGLAGFAFVRRRRAHG